MRAPKADLNQRYSTVSPVYIKHIAEQCLAVTKPLLVPRGFYYLTQTWVTSPACGLQPHSVLAHPA